MIQQAQPHSFQIQPHSRKKEIVKAQNQSPIKKEQPESNKFLERLKQFLSNGWSMFRFSFYLLAFSYFVFILFSTLSAVPENGHISFSLIIQQIIRNISSIIDSFPFLRSLFDKLGNSLSNKYWRTGLFFSVLFATISSLIFFCS